MSVPRRNFLLQEAPVGYVAGIGRGATGFTTSSDLGSVQDGAGDELIQAALRRRAKPELSRNEDEDNERYQDAEEERGLFASLPYDKDDEEADKIFKLVDSKMAARRRRQREIQEKIQEQQAIVEGTKIQRNFADAKRALASVTDEEWAAIPDVGDLTKKKRRKEPRRERFYAVSDSVLLSAQKQTEYATEVQEVDGTVSVSGTKTNFEEIGAARDKMLGIKLDQMSQGGAISTIDPKSYLTELNNMIPKVGGGVGDFERARLLLQSVTKTNPKHAPGWIAAARVEELAGKMILARNIIAQGCENCPKNEDVWIESIRLNENDTAKVIVSEAVKHLPKSLNLWLQALELESELKSKRKIIRKALECLPRSVKLWMVAVNLETDPNDAKLLLARSVELLPESVELWLALARLETYNNAKSVLNKARQAIKTSYEIWIAAARLEEQQGNDSRVEAIINRGIKELESLGALLQREQWIAEAEICEKEGNCLTAQAIITATLGLGLDSEDEFQTYIDDTEALIERGSIECARSALSYALRKLPNKYELWRKAIDLEKTSGTESSLEKILERAVVAMPHHENLWLLYAREKWQAKQVEQARLILSRAFEMNPNQEEIWLAAVKIEFESGEYDRARILLKIARAQASTERIWSKSVVLERQLNDKDAALSLVDEALQKFPKFDKLWMLKGQIWEDLNDLAKARESFTTGTKNCPHSLPLWVLLAKVELKSKVLIRCRNVLERARVLNPNSDILSHLAIQIELKTDVNQAKTLISKALQECPSSGLLWSDLISTEPRSQQRSRAIDALRKAENDPYLLATIARLFVSERKLDKAKDWYMKAIASNKDIGDTWALFYSYLKQHGTDLEIKHLKERFLLANPRHGLIWPQISKNVNNCKLLPLEILELVSEKLEKGTDGNSIWA